MSEFRHSIKGFGVPKHNFETTFLEKLKRECTLTPTDVRPLNMRQGTAAPTPIQVWRESPSFLFVPRAYARSVFKRDFDQATDLLEDEPLPPESDTLNFVKKLRPLQYAIIQPALFEILEKGGGQLQLSTGFGKTVVCLYMLSQLKRPALVVINTELLLKQWLNEISVFVPAARVGIIQGDRCDLDFTEYDIVIAMVQTLSQRLFTNRIKSSDFKKCGVLVLDECDRLSTEKYSLVMSSIHPRYRIAMSATAKRSDGMHALLEMCVGPCVAKYEQVMRQAVVHFLHVPYTFSDLEKVARYRKGDIDRLATVRQICKLETTRRSELIVEALLKMFQDGRKCLVLCTEIRHCNFLFTLFMEKLGYMPSTVRDGVEVANVVKVHGQVKNTKKEPRALLLDRDWIFGTYSLLSVGLSFNHLDSICFATPKPEVTQSVGRVLRDPKAKRTPLILDVVDECLFLHTQWKTKRLHYYKQQKFDVVDSVIII